MKKIENILNIIPGVGYVIAIFAKVGYSIEYAFLVAVVIHLTCLLGFQGYGYFKKIIFFRKNNFLHALSLFGVVMFIALAFLTYLDPDFQSFIWLILILIIIANNNLTSKNYSAYIVNKQLFIEGVRDSIFLTDVMNIEHDYSNVKIATKNNSFSVTIKEKKERDRLINCWKA